MEELLTLLEEQLLPYSCERGDEESFRLLEETRDHSLARAEEEFFSRMLSQKLTTPKSLLFLDLGGPPRLGVKLLSVLPRTISVGYLRVDPNPASLLETKRVIPPSLPHRLLMVDPAISSLQETDWSYIYRSVDCCVVLVGGCAINAFLGHQKAFVESFFKSATLSLASCLSLAQLPNIIRRLQRVKDRGALFDTIRIKPVQIEGEQRIYQEELVLTFSEEVPRLDEIFGYYELGVAIKDGPTFPLVYIYSEEYIQRELFAGFQMEAGPITGEGQPFSLRFAH